VRVLHVEDYSRPARSASDRQEGTQYRTIAAFCRLKSAASALSSLSEQASIELSGFDIPFVD